MQVEYREDLRSKLLWFPWLMPRLGIKSLLGLGFISAFFIFSYMFLTPCITGFNFSQVPSGIAFTELAVFIYFSQLNRHKIKQETDRRLTFYTFARRKKRYIQWRYLTQIMCPTTSFPCGYGLSKPLSYVLHKSLSRMWAST